tara:strand:- start:2332 stop:2901 length:570 start_codon:yes stop_codon:yes gene_type:complete
MKFAPLMVLPFLVAPAQAESIGDRSNRQAYEQVAFLGSPSSAHSIETRTSRSKLDWWKKFDPDSPEYYKRRVATNSYQRGYSSTETCTREEYREEYVPGTANHPGYVRSWHDTVEIPCRRHSSPPVIRERVIRERTPSPDGNECSEGAILGGILGGGAGAALSQGDGRWWAIPLGVVTGSVIGCDIDGG